MENKTMCPICHHQAKYASYSGPYGLEEEYTYCPTCGFREEFAYGGYFKEVGNKYFIWDYTFMSNHNKWLKLIKKISKAEFMARRNWKKFKKKTNADNCPI